MGPSFPSCLLDWLYTDDRLPHWGMMIPHGKARKNNEYFMRWDRRIFNGSHVNVGFTRVDIYPLVMTNIAMENHHAINR